MARGRQLGGFRAVPETVGPVWGKNMPSSTDVQASAPTRIDLAGGTLDIWPLYLFHPGAMTLNMAIDLRATVSVRPVRGSGHRVRGPGMSRWVDLPVGWKRSRHGANALFVHALRALAPGRGMDVRFSTRAPQGSGLAGSSALLSALCGALLAVTGRQGPRKDLVPVLRDIETGLLGVPAGVQDYYPALFGGVQALRWGVGQVQREAIPRVGRELEKRLVLVYTGRSRWSGSNNWEIAKRYLDGDRKTRALFERIVHAAGDLYKALKRRDFQSVGRAMAMDAHARTSLYPGIRTPEIRDLERILKRNGALAVKVCGAGGGGCVVAYAPPEVCRSLADAALAGGYTPLGFRSDGKGLTVRRSGA